MHCIHCVVTQWMQCQRVWTELCYNKEETERIINALVMHRTWTCTISNLIQRFLTQFRRWITSSSSSIFNIYSTWCAAHCEQARTITYQSAYTRWNETKTMIIKAFKNFIGIEPNEVQKKKNWNKKKKKKKNK